MILEKLRITDEEAFQLIIIKGSSTYARSIAGIFLKGTFIVPHVNLVN